MFLRDPVGIRAARLFLFLSIFHNPIIITIKGIVLASYGQDVSLANPMLERSIDVTAEMSLLSLADSCVVVVG